MRIIVVDADKQSRHDVVRQLRNKRYTATGVDDAASLYRNLAAEPFDVVILDSTLPGEDGLSVARYLREFSQVVVIIFSDDPSLEHRLACLASGADACLIKPVDSRELVAILASFNRRAGTRHVVAPAANASAGAWTLLSNSWQLVSPVGTVIALTSAEHSLLSLLMRQSGAPVSRKDIVAELGHDYRHYDDRRLEAIVSRLRRKLKLHQGVARPLKTAHGYGYAFTAAATIR
ncbi:response regulator transcription factor [Paraburkholderia youngii]|uniref:response regulator transcription factor n=1 Tax=Paraburkholderia youngii TaxID=2782701 RepID=UPI003D1F771A